jgi:hypothetical protein
MQLGKLAETKGFNTTDNVFHQTKLAALVHQHRLDLRGVVNSDAKYGQRANLTATEVADLLMRNAADVAAVNSFYGRAIKREREKGTAAQ